MEPKVEQSNKKMPLRSVIWLSRAKPKVPTETATNRAKPWQTATPPTLLDQGPRPPPTYLSTIKMLLNISILYIALTIVFMHANIGCEK